MSIKIPPQNEIVSHVLALHAGLYEESDAGGVALFELGHLLAHLEKDPKEKKKYRTDIVEASSVNPTRQLSR